MMNTSEVIARGIKTAWMLQESSMILYFQLLQPYRQFTQAYIEAVGSTFLKPLDMSVLSELVPPVWCGERR